MVGHLPPSDIVTTLIGQSVTCVPGASKVLLVGEHAGHEVPAPWGDLGLSSAFLASHFGVDIGIRNLITQVARRADAPAVLARYSRIFLDYNRPETSVEYCRPDLGGIPIPGNLSVAPQEMALRQAVAAQPLDRAIERGMQDAEILFPIHSFTPVMNGEIRELDVGILYDEVTPLVAEVGGFLAAKCRDHGLRFDYEKPYVYNPAHNETLKRHGYDPGRSGFQIEVRNDLLEGGPPSEAIYAIVSDLVAHISA